MKFAIVLACVLAVVCVSEAFVCPPNFCESVSCTEAPTANNCDGTLVPNSSFCGCCPTCFKYLPAGSRCSPMAFINLQATHRQVCEIGTHCVNEVCVPFEKQN